MTGFHTVSHRASFFVIRVQRLMPNTFGMSRAHAAPIASSRTSAHFVPCVRCFIEAVVLRAYISLHISEHNELALHCAGPNGPQLGQQHAPSSSCNKHHGASNAVVFGLCRLTHEPQLDHCRRRPCCQGCPAPCRQRCSCRFRSVLRRFRRASNPVFSSGRRLSRSILQRTPPIPPPMYSARPATRTLKITFSA
jgi:hypothetical protein